jgi:hypothetical protein
MFDRHHQPTCLAKASSMQFMIAFSVSRYSIEIILTLGLIWWRTCLLSSYDQINPSSSVANKKSNIKTNRSRFQLGDGMRKVVCAAHIQKLLVHIGIPREPVHRIWTLAVFDELHIIQIRGHHG